MRQDVQLSTHASDLIAQEYSKLVEFGSVSESKIDTLIFVKQLVTSAGVQDLQEQQNAVFLGTFSKFFG